MRLQLLAFLLAIGMAIPLSKPLLGFFNMQSDISESQLSDTYDFSQKNAVFHKNQIEIPKAQPSFAVATASETSDVLGSKSKKTEKRIEVDLAKQKLYAYEGNKKVMSFLVSTGKWNRTPTGEFRVWTKLRYTLMTGGSKALGTYYYLPNVPFTMFFYNDSYPKHLGYGIHGAYWHNNFGQPMSHGCINMKIDEAGKLFNWAPADVKVKIYGKAP